MDNGACSYRRFLAGDDSGLESLIREYRDPLIFYIFTFVHSTAEAEDVVQDTFIKLAIKKPGYNGKASFRTWLYTIAGNVARDYLRRRNSRREVPLEEAADAADEEELADALLTGERKAVLHSAMKALPDSYRAALHLIYFEGMSNKEAAAVLGKTVHAAENLVSKARKALRQQLEKDGYNDEDV